MSNDSKISELERSVRSNLNVDNVTRLANIYSRLGREQSPKALLDSIGDIKRQIFEHFEVFEHKDPIADATNYFWFTHSNGNQLLLDIYRHNRGTLKEFGISNVWDVANEAPSDLDFQDFVSFVRNQLSFSGFDIRDFYWPKEKYTLVHYPLDSDDMFWQYVLLDNSKEIKFEKLYEDYRKEAQ